MELNTLLAAIMGSGVLVSVLVAGAKKIESLPVSSGQTGRIRILVAALSVISTVAVRYANHTLSDPQWIQSVIEVFGTYLIAHLTHKAVLSDPNN